MFKTNPVPPHQRAPVKPEVTEKLDWDVPDDDPLRLSQQPEVVSPPPKKLGVNEVAPVWYAMKKLPSRFKPYPAGTTVSYRPYTFNEVETLSTSIQTTSERFISILDGIETKGIHPLDLSMGDFICIAMYRKFSTMGTEEVVITFAADGALHKHVMRANALNFDELEIELPIIMSVDVPDKGLIEIEFMPVTVRQWLAYQNVPEEVRADIPDHHAMLALGSDQPLEEMISFVSNATGEVMQMLTAVDMALYHGIADLLVPIKEKKPNPDWAEAEATRKPDEKNFYPQFIETVIKTVRVEVKEDSMLVTPFRGSDTTSKNGLRFGRRGDS